MADVAGQQASFAGEHRGDLLPSGWILQVRSRTLSPISRRTRTGRGSGSDRGCTLKRVRGVISTKPGPARYLHTAAGRILRTDAQALQVEERLDGRYLLRSTDPTLSAEDIALGYRQLTEVGRDWRNVKHVLDLRRELERPHVGTSTERPARSGNGPKPRQA